MRLGLYEAKLAEGSLAAEVYGDTTASERHRHRYEVNNAYRDEIAAAGLSFSGLSPDGQPRRVCRAAPRGAPVLHRHPGAPRAALASRQAAPAVRWPRRCRDRAPRGCASLFEVEEASGE